MPVSNPSRNIQRDYKLELLLAHAAKTMTGGPLPFTPAKPPANQPKDYCTFFDRLRGQNDAV